MSKSLRQLLSEPCIVCGARNGVQATPTFYSSLQLCQECREIAADVGLVDPTEVDS